MCLLDVAKHLSAHLNTAAVQPARDRSALYAFTEKGEIFFEIWHNLTQTESMF